VKKQPTRGVTQPTRVRWTSPMEQNYKGNFDGALFDASTCAGIRVVF